MTPEQPTKRSSWGRVMTTIATAVGWPTSYITGIVPRCQLVVRWSLWAVDPHRYTPNVVPPEKVSGQSRRSIAVRAARVPCSVFGRHAADDPAGVVSGFALRGPSGLGVVLG
jgi:hypothetical protein